MIIKTISYKDPLLDDIKILGRKNAKTLGMFPDGAYTEYARRNGIMAAIEGNELLGYILFRVTQSKRIISIAHLCVNNNHRGKGVSTQLLNSVKQKYCQQLRGISLSCREDYNFASKLWQEYGFKPMGRNRSRSKEEKYLVKWFYDFGNQDLFSSIILQTSKLNALLDSNIIIKMRDEPNYDNTEVIALNADWLEEEVDYYYAPEIYNEIRRDENKDRAKSTREFLQHFKQAHFNPQDSDDIFISLGSIFAGTSSNDLSDRRQIAECIASNQEYFITLDEGILTNSDIIFDKYKLKILRPTDFILFIDQLRNTKDYISYRVAGAQYEYKKIGPEDISSLVQLFVQEKNGEKGHDLRKKLSIVATDVKNSVIRLVTNTQNATIAFFAGLYQLDNLAIHVIRTYKEKIGVILFQQLLSDIIQLSLDKKLNTISIIEPHFNDEQAMILQSFGFERKEFGWFKIVLTGLCSSSELLPNFSIIRNNWNAELLNERLQSLKGDDLKVFQLDLERKLWPLKIADCELPVYIIPIRSYWSSQLFDHQESSQNLFGCKAELAWSKENVYYRSVKPVSEVAPARILWYVSGSNQSTIGRHSGIVACSYLEEVYIGSAKSLFQKFKNYGIYEWKHIYELARRDPFKNIKALRFGDTEVFKKIISYKKIIDILKQNGMPPNTFASPVKVTKAIFNDIYKIQLSETDE